MKLRPFLGVLAVMGLSSVSAFAGEPANKKEDGGIVKASGKDAEAEPGAEGEASAADSKGPEGDAPAGKPEGDASEIDGTPAGSGSRIVSVGIGGLFMGGANFFDKPGDQTINGQNRDSKYPGFAGSSIGGGGYVDVRFIDYVGFEFGVLHMTDKGTADLTITDLTSGAQANFKVNLSQPALHMPLLLKAAVPGVIAQPVFFVGPEFVIPLASCKADATDRATKDECQAEVVSTSGNASLGTKYGIITQNSVNVMFGLGAEFKLPIPKVDIRIPLTLRGSINPGVSDKRDDREKDTVNANGSLERVDYVTNWKFAAYGNIGAAIHF
jgi:hypothetical protein